MYHMYVSALEIANSEEKYHTLLRRSAMMGPPVSRRSPVGTTEGRQPHRQGAEVRIEAHGSGSRL